MAEHNCENCARKDCAFMPPPSGVHCGYWKSDTPAVNRWIPYSEKRPDLWGEYLTYNAENGAMYVLSFSPYDNTFGIYDGNVTHWMPLPEPPEKE